MSDELAKTTEEAQLEIKRAQLEELSQALAVRELDLEELKIDIARFQHRYFSAVGRKYVELDSLRAQLAEMKARYHPDDSALKQEADVARRHSRKTSEEYEALVSKSEPHLNGGLASDEIRRLYLSIARVIHPDKAMDDKSRLLRTKLMAELNEAYAQKDVVRMQDILASWQASPDAVLGEGTIAELERVTRTIAQVSRRMAEIQVEISQIMASDLHVLMIRVRDADQNGRNMLKEMAEALDADIQAAREQILNLRGT